MRAMKKNLLIYTGLYTLLSLALAGAALYFGRSLVQAWDAFDQHYPNLIYMCRYYHTVASNLLQGNFCFPTFDLSLGEGQSILYTLYFYGIADPFNYPLVFIPESGVIYYYDFLLLLRPYLAGLAFLGFCRSKGYGGPEALAGVFLYLLSGFGIYALSVHPFFMNAMIGLPLMVMGFDRVRERRSPVLFILTVFIMALQGFYFTYMVSLMVVVYALVCVLTPEDRSHPVRDGFALFGRCVGFYLIGLLMAMFVFLPGIIGYLQSNRMTAVNEYNLFTYSLDTLRYKLTNLIAIRYDDDCVALPAAGLCAVILLFGSDFKSNRRLTVLTVFAFAAYLLPVFSLIFNGGNIYARHVFGLIFLTSFATVRMIHALSEGSKHISLAHCAAFIILAVLLVAQGAFYENHTEWQQAALLLWCLEAGLTVFFVNRPVVRKGLLTGFVITCAFFNAALVAPTLLYNLRTGSPLQEYAGSAMAQAAAYAGESEEEAFYRIDADDRDCYFYNVGTVLDFSSTRTYTSLLPIAQTELWRELALTSGDSGYQVYGSDARTALEELSGVTYYATGNDGEYRVPYGFSQAGTSEDGTKCIYRNEYALSLGYVYTNTIAKADWQAADSVAKTDLMLQGVYLEENSEAAVVSDAVIKEHTGLLAATVTYDEGILCEDGQLTITEPGACVTIEFENQTEAETYLRLVGVRTKEDLTGAVILSDGEELHMRLVSSEDVHYFGRTEYCYNLGYEEESGTSVVKLRFDTTGAFTLEGIEVESFSMEDYVEEVTALSESMLEVSSTGQGRIIGTIEVQQEGILVLAIPYMKGYRISLDGTEQTYTCGNIHYVALSIGEGTHRIEITYENPGQKAGLILSAVGLGLFLVLILFRRKKVLAITGAVLTLALCSAGLISDGVLPQKQESESVCEVAETATALSESESSETESETAEAAYILTPETGAPQETESGKENGSTVTGPRLSELSDVDGDLIRRNRVESEEDLSEGITFNGNALFAVSGGSYFYSLIEGDEKAYDPVVQVGDALSVVCEEGTLSEENLAKGEVLQLLIYNDTSYTEIEVTPTTLPLLSISCTESIQHEGDTEMSFCLYDNREDVSERLTVSAGKIHTRGRSTLDYPKKGYRLTLLKEDKTERKVNLLGLRKDGDWILYAAYNDQEKLRNVFSMQLWFNGCATDNSFGVVNGMEYRYVEVFLNGEYHGLYALGYPVDAKQLSLADASDIEDKEYMFSKTRGTDDAEVLTEEGGLPSGYELKNRYVDQTVTDASTRALRSFFCIVNDENSSDEELLACADLNNAIDISLFYCLIIGCDNVGGKELHNTYITLKNAEGMKQALYSPWDLDITWGNNWEYEAPNHTLEYEIWVGLNYSMPMNPVTVLLERGNETVLTRVKERYEELREGAWSDEAIAVLLDGYESDIYGSGARVREEERWPNGNYNELSEGLDRFREYVKERLRYMDAYIESL